jgi:HlyD family secretion protein
VEKTISSTGTLEVEGKLPILSRITAPINSVKVAVEQRVSRGQILAVLDTMDIDQRLLRLSTKLESSQLAVTSEQRKYEGKKNMFKENLVSSKDLEQTELEYKTALNNYRLAQLEYNETVSQKRDAVMRSPIDGVIIESAISGLSVIRQNDAAFFVAPSLSRMQLILNIDESDMGSVRKGQKVSFTVSAFPDKKFNGEITGIAINPDKRGGLVTYQSFVRCDNNEMLLKPGMTATATIIVARKENVLRVPNQAFVVTPKVKIPKKPAGPFIWKKTGAISSTPFAITEVKTGLTGDMYTEITGQVKTGDEILIKMRQVENR